MSIQHYDRKKNLSSVHNYQARQSLCPVAGGIVC